jgi:AcrR family transcriptional regulator
MSRPSPTSSGDVPPRNPRDEILAAAAALLGEGGEAGLTIRRLALRSGYTSPAIYQQFGDKAGLLDAILARAIEALAVRLESLPASPAPRQAMRANFKAIVRFGREHPTHYRLMEALQPESSPNPNAEALRQLVERPIGEMTRAGEDVELLRQSLWALLHGLISLPALRPDVAWLEDLDDVALDAMLNGLFGREEPAGSPR